MASRRVEAPLLINCSTLQRSATRGIHNIPLIEGLVQQGLATVNENGLLGSGNPGNFITGPLRDPGHTLPRCWGVETFRDEARDAALNALRLYV